MRTRNNTGKKGFTTIELMIVLAILGLLVVMATPGVRRQIAIQKIRNDAREIDGALQLAKTRSMSTGMPYGVGFDRTPNGREMGRIVIFIDCNRDGLFTDNDSVPTNNTSVSSPSDCAGLAYDPLMNGIDIMPLSDGVYFTNVFGTKAKPSANSLESVVFDFLGHALQGANIVVGEVNLQNDNEIDGKVDSIGVRLFGGTGMTGILSMIKVDKDEWKTGP